MLEEILRKVQKLPYIFTPTYIHLIRCQNGKGRNVSWEHDHCLSIFCLLLENPLRLSTNHTFINNTFEHIRLAVEPILQTSCSSFARNRSPYQRIWSSIGPHLEQSKRQKEQFKSLNLLNNGNKFHSRRPRVRFTVFCLLVRGINNNQPPLITAMRYDFRISAAEKRRCTERRLLMADITIGIDRG